MKTVFWVGIGFTLLSLLAFFVVPNALAAIGVGGSEKTSQGQISIDDINPDNIEEIADEYYSIYTSVIDDILSYQQNPDYSRVEARREATVKQAQDLIPRFKALARTMRDRYDRLNEQAMSTPQPAP